MSRQVSISPTRIGLVAAVSIIFITFLVATSFSNIPRKRSDPLPKKCLKVAMSAKNTKKQLAREHFQHLNPGSKKKSKPKNRLPVNIIILKRHSTKALLNKAKKTQRLIQKREVQLKYFKRQIVQLKSAIEKLAKHKERQKKIMNQIKIRCIKTKNKKMCHRKVFASFSSP